MRTQVFISYSHKDKRWLDRLRIHLKPLERDGLFDRWDDTKINPGAKWREEMKAALDSARVAILAVSADFLASDFITENELPPLLAAAERDGAVIIPLILSRCRFQETPAIAQFQSVNPPSRPLTAMTKNEQEEVFYKLTKAVEEALREPAAVAGSTKRLPGLPERNLLFSGRQDILAQIQKALKLTDALR